MRSFTGQKFVLHAIQSTDCRVCSDLSPIDKVFRSDRGKTFCGRAVERGVMNPWTSEEDAWWWCLWTPGMSAGKETEGAGKEIAGKIKHALIRQISTVSGFLVCPRLRQSLSESLLIAQPFIPGVSRAHLFSTSPFPPSSSLPNSGPCSPGLHGSGMKMTSRMP